MQKLVFTNGGGQSIDLTSGNFGITNWEGLSGVGLNIQTQTVPFQDGGVFLDALMEQREISVTVAIQDNNDLSLRYELKRQLISALNPKLGEGVLVYTNDYLSRQIKAVPQLPIFENKNSNDAGTLKASVVFSCPSPYWEDLEDTVVEIKGMSIIQNDGDVPAQVEITIPAGSSNPSIGNRTNLKQIKINGSFDNAVVIDTQVGQKKVTSEEIGFTWESGGYFADVIFADGKYIFVGSIIVVEDYVTGKRTVADSGTSNSLGGIAYGNGLFVAVGIYGTIITSPDGITWTQRTSGTSNHLKRIAYGNGLFVAVGSKYPNESILTSSDGITWTERGTGLTNKSLNSVTYGNGLFVIAGAQALLTSSDGITWTDRHTQDMPLFSCVGYGNGLFIVGGIRLDTYTSPDGITWTQRYNGTDNADRLYSIAYGNNTFVGVGNKEGATLEEYNAEVLTSPDGITWTERVPELPSWELSAIIFKDGLFVGTGRNGIIATTPDGIEWTVLTAESDIGSMVFGKGLFVSAFNDLIAGNIIQTSPDGKTWTERYRESGENVVFTFINFINNIFIFGKGKNIVISQDGITWTEKNTGSTELLHAITYGEGKYIAVGDEGTILSSIDLNTWTEETSGVNDTITSVVYGNGLFVATCYYNPGPLLTSTDGINWTISGNISGISKVVFGNNMFVGVGYWLNYILTSTDGVTWTQRAIGLVDKLESIIYNNGLFVAVGVGVYTSTDGINWTEKVSGFGEGLFSVAYGNGVYMLKGRNGELYNSYLIQTQNLISDLTTDSDMTFNLEKGSNNIFFSDNNNKTATLSFRQKYIGV